MRKKSKKNTLNPLIRIIVIVMALLIIVFGTYKALLMPVSNSIEEKKIEIPLGSGVTQIARILKDNNLIRSEFIFKIYVKKHNIVNFQAGTYYLKESMTISEISEMLQKGIMYDPNQISLTYIEGKPMWWLAETIQNKTNNTKEDVYALLNDEEYINSLIEEYWFLTDIVKDKDIYYPLEGYLFPDTYSISNKDAKVEEIFKKMLDKMEDILDDYKKEIDTSNYSIHELLTIASIVETEGTDINSRKDVASVIYNRLNAGMSLGSDVTTYYSAKIDMGDRDLYQKEINNDNPYNTRGPNMEGKLPVGPISSVSKTSIEAAIKPNETDYLFFVADKNGKLYFTKTNSEHLQVINELQRSGNWYEYE